MGIMKYKLEKICHVKLQQNLWNQIRQFITLRTLGFIPSRLSPHGVTAPQCARVSPLSRHLDHTQTHRTR
jgi:hypothetical protein